MDVNDWFEEFCATAIANQEDDAAKLRIFLGLLKEEAGKWAHDQPQGILNDMRTLFSCFILAFCDIGGGARALGLLNKISMSSKESICQNGQRVKDLIRKMGTNPLEEYKIQWFINGLPDKMAFQIRREKPDTFREAMEAAWDYEDSTKLSRKAIKTKKKSKKRLKSKGHN